MKSIWIIIIIIYMIDWTDSAKIITSINAKKFMANSTAKLSCAFPSSYNILMWNNVKLPKTLKCKNETPCDIVPGYNISRQGDNITLIIERVVPDMNKWRCSDLLIHLSEYINFTVVVNPPLKMTIVNTGKSTWELTTSCSNPLPNVTCQNNNGISIPITNTSSQVCSENLLSSLKYTITSQNSNFIKCFATRGTVQVIENGTSQLVTSTIGDSTAGTSQLVTSTIGDSTAGLPKLELKIRHLPNCIYRIESSCTIFNISFTCINKNKKMDLENVVHNCPDNTMKSYNVDLKGLAYGTTFNCTTSDGMKKYSIQETVSCHLPFYTSGGLIISIGLVFVGVGVTTYLFNIGMIKNANIWKFVIWYIGIIFVDVGVMLFLWTLSWEFVNTVFLPFFLLLAIKDVIIILIGLYIHKNGGFFFMTSSKVFTNSTSSPDSQNQSSRQSTPM